jgi:PilZ domain
MASNRRQDPRISAPSVGVRIRKSGFGFHRWADDPTLVDVSSSGLSITSSNLRLKTLNKVEFELTLGGKSMSGSAIVCHVGNNSSQHKYGLLFITANTDIDHFINEPLLSTDQAKRLGEELAGRFIYQNYSDVTDVELQEKNQLMLDAVKAMATRLGEMGLFIKDELGAEMTPEKALIIGPHGEISFPALSDANQIARFSISTIKSDADNSKQYLYQLPTGEQSHDLVDVLEYVGASFDQISISN